MTTVEVGFLMVLAIRLITDPSLRWPDESLESLLPINDLIWSLIRGVILYRISCISENRKETKFALFEHSLFLLIVKFSYFFLLTNISISTKSVTLSTPAACTWLPGNTRRICLKPMRKYRLNTITPSPRRGKISHGHTSVSWRTYYVYYRNWTSDI